MSLQVKNDWETLYYYDDGKKIGNPSQIIKRVSVMWENGSVVEYDAKWRTAMAEWHDMKESGIVHQQQLYIAIQTNGTDIAFPLYQHLRKLHVEVVKQPLKLRAEVVPDSNVSHTEDKIAQAVYETTQFQIAVQNGKTTWNYPISDTCLFAQVLIEKLRKMR